MKVVANAGVKVRNRSSLFEIVCGFASTVRRRIGSPVAMTSHANMTNYRSISRAVLGRFHKGHTSKGRLIAPSNKSFGQIVCVFVTASATQIPENTDTE